MTLLAILIPLAIAFVVGLVPAIDEGVKQVTWLVAIAIAAGAAIWDWRRRVNAQKERARLHEQRMAERGYSGPRPPQDDEAAS